MHVRCRQWRSCANTSVSEVSPVRPGFNLACKRLLRAVIIVSGVVLALELYAVLTGFDFFPSIIWWEGRTVAVRATEFSTCIPAALGASVEPTDPKDLELGRGYNLNLSTYLSSEVLGTLERPWGAIQRRNDDTAEILIGAKHSPWRPSVRSAVDSALTSIATTVESVCGRHEAAVPAAGNPVR